MKRDPITRRRPPAARARTRYKKDASAEPQPKAEPWGGTPLDYVSFHRAWNELCAPIPLTDAGQQIRLYIHETLQRLLSTLPAPDPDEGTAAELAEAAEYRMAKLIQAGIDAGKVLPIMRHRLRRRRRTTTLDPRPPWAPGPFC
jgi:hypothetical protein